MVKGYDGVTGGFRFKFQCGQLKKKKKHLPIKNDIIIK